MGPVRPQPHAQAAIMRHQPAQSHTGPPSAATHPDGERPPHGPHPTTEDPGNPRSAPPGPQAPPAATAAADQTPGTHAHTSGGNSARNTRTHPGKQPSAKPTSASRTPYTASRRRPPREHLKQLPDHRSTLSGNRRIRAPAAGEGTYRDQVTGRRRRRSEERRVGKEGRAW